MRNLTRIQQLERENKDLKIQNQNLKKQNRILKEEIEDIKKSYDTKFELMNKRFDALYNDLSKANSRIKELEEENKELKNIIKQKDKKIEELNNTIANLTARIKKDSSNSSKPSSTDGFKKQVHNFRQKTGKRVGGQFGHKGNRLELFLNPTEVVELKDEKCACGGDIIYNTKPGGVKQKVDIEVLTKITEYRALKGRCKACGTEHKTEFPEGIINTVQYGDNLKSLVAVLLNEGMVSMKRIVELISSITNNIINLSEGTVSNINYELSKNCKPIVEEIKAELIKADILCVDESGVRINGKLNWIHTACTEYTTLYKVDKKRGNEATDSMGILAYFVGVLMHDHLKAYYNYKTMEHAECNAHILRYLKGVIEIFKREEAEELLSFLVKTNNDKKQAINQNMTSFSVEEIERIENEYINILSRWQFKYNTETANLKDTKYHNDERCLIERLIEYKDEHLRFIKNFKVPFDNNSAERALRMIKTKIKVSGGFRSENGSNSFAIIRSVISTFKKRRINIYQTFKKIFSGETVALG